AVFDTDLHGVPCRHRELSSEPMIPVRSQTNGGAAGPRRTGSPPGDRSWKRNAPLRCKTLPGSGGPTSSPLLRPLDRDVPGPLPGEEFEEGLVDLFGVRPADVVWSALDLDELDVAHEAGETPAGGVDGEDAVLGALDHEQGNVDLRQVGAEVRQPGRHAREGGVRGRTGRHLEAGVPSLVADAGAVELVDVVEVVEEELEPSVAVLLDGFHEAVEDALRYSLRVVLGLEQERWDRSDQR